MNATKKWDMSGPGHSPSKKRLSSITCPIILCLSAWQITPPLIHGKAFGREEGHRSSKRATNEKTSALPLCLPLGSRTPWASSLGEPRFELSYRCVPTDGGWKWSFLTATDTRRCKSKISSVTGKQTLAPLLSGERVTLRINGVAQADRIWHGMRRLPFKDTCDRSCTTCGRARRFLPSYSSSHSPGCPAGEQNIKQQQSNVPRRGSGPGPPTRHRLIPRGT